MVVVAYLVRSLQAGKAAFGLSYHAAVRHAAKVIGKFMGGVLVGFFSAIWGETVMPHYGGES